MLRRLLPPILLDLLARVWEWLNADPDDRGSRVHLYAFQEAKRTGVGRSRRFHLRAFAAVRVPRNPVCAVLGCRWGLEDPYTLPRPLFGRWDPWKGYRAEYERKAEQYREREREQAVRMAAEQNHRRKVLGQPLIDPDRDPGWPVCLRCRRRRQVATDRAGRVLDQAVLETPAVRRVEASAEIYRKPEFDLNLAVKIGTGDGDNGLGLDVAVPYVGKAYLRLEGVMPRVVEYLTPRLGESRETEVRLHRDSIGGWVFRWKGHVADVMGEEIPKWGSWRNQYVNINRTIGGGYERREIGSEIAEILVPMPEGTYRATATLTETENWLKRTPWRKKRRYGVRVEIPGGIPTPGNLDSDFYDGEDATHSVSTGITYAHGWQSQAIGLVVRSVMEERYRHGSGADWQPQAVRDRIKAEQREKHGLTAAEALGDVPLPEGVERPASEPQKPRVGVLQDDGSVKPASAIEGLLKATGVLPDDSDMTEETAQINIGGRVFIAPVGTLPPSDLDNPEAPWREIGEVASATFTATGESQPGDHHDHVHVAHPDAAGGILPPGAKPGTVGEPSDPEDGSQPDEDGGV
jgi:hypothetical protein